jgi:hypothetical protein
MSGTALELVGLVLGLVASCLLAYPILFGWPKSNVRAIKVTQLDNLRQFLRTMEQRYDAFPAPFTQADKDAEKAALHREYDPKVSALEDEIRRLGAGHEERSFYISGFAMLVLGLGFLGQLIGLLKREGPQVPPPIPKISVTMSVAPFVTGIFGYASADDVSGAIAKSVCTIREKFAANHSTVALVVGRYDRRPIGASLRRWFTGNPGLALKRAELVASQLADATLCPTPPVVGMPLVSAPRLIEPLTGLTRQETSHVLEADRVVEVTGIVFESRSSPPH